MISVKDITKSFGNITAVDNLNFHVNKGEIFGIVGPDGAGKSTLLRMIAGIMEPDAGEIRIDNKVFKENRYKIKENLAYMPQRFGLYEDLTVEENIIFFGRLFGVSRREIKKRVPGLYEFSRLEPFKDRLAGKLSGGMKQKLGLACSLIHSPDLILLDEPTNGVDPVSRREFWKILYSLLSDGVTIVVSTAYLDEAERCNRVSMMNDGRFIRSGTPTEIKNFIGGLMLEVITSNVWKAEEVLVNKGKFKNIIREGNAIKIFILSGKTAARMGGHRTRRGGYHPPATIAPIARDIKIIKELLDKAKIKVLSIRKQVPTLENCFMEIAARNG